MKLESSVESKGIVGNDGRHYILDLLRTFPPDVNYLPGSHFSAIFITSRVVITASFVIWFIMPFPFHF